MAETLETVEVDGFSSDDDDDELCLEDGFDEEGDEEEAEETKAGDAVEAMVDDDPQRKRKRTAGAAAEDPDEDPERKRAAVVAGEDHEGGAEDAGMEEAQARMEEVRAIFHEVTEEFGVGLPLGVKQDTTRPPEHTYEDLLRCGTEGAQIRQRTPFKFQQDLDNPDTTHKQLNTQPRLNCDLFVPPSHVRKEPSKFKKKKDKKKDKGKAAGSDQSKSEDKGGESKEEGGESKEEGGHKQKKKKPRRILVTKHKDRKNKHRAKMRNFDWSSGNIPENIDPPRLINLREQRRLESARFERLKNPKEKKVRPEGKMSRREQRDHMASKHKSKFSDWFLNYKKELKLGPLEEIQLDIINHDEKKTDRTNSGRYPQSSHSNPKEREDWTSVKSTLNVLTAHQQVPDQSGNQRPLARLIEGFVDSQQKFPIELSLFANFYVRERLDAGLPLPALESDFFRLIYSLLSDGNPKQETLDKYPDIVDSFDTFDKFREGAKPKYEPNVTDAFREQYETNCKVHVVDSVPATVVRYVKFWLDVNTRNPTSQSRWWRLKTHENRKDLEWMIRQLFVARLCWKKTDTRERNERVCIDELAHQLGDDMAYEILCHVLTIQNRYYVTYKLSKHEEKHYFLFDGQVVHMNNYWMYIPLLRDLQKAMEDWVAKDPRHQGTAGLPSDGVAPDGVAPDADAAVPVHAEQVRKYKLLPVSDFKVKHIILNKTTAKDFAAGVEGRKKYDLSDDEFRRLLVKWFPGAVELGSKKGLEVASLHVEGNSASVLFKKPKQAPDAAATVDDNSSSSPAQNVRSTWSPPRKDHDPITAKQFLDSVLWDKNEVDPNMPKFVFIDPGVKSIITCQEGGKDWGMSNAHYHCIRGTKHTKVRMDGLKEGFFDEKDKTVRGTKAKLKHFEEHVTPKAITAERFLAYIKALYPLLDDLLEFNKLKSVKRCRFKSYVRKQKALEAVHDRIYNFGELRKTRNDLIVPVFGDADFMGKGMTRGHRLVPITSLKRFLRHKQKHRQGRLYFLDEFRSSKLCHGCFKALKPFKTEDGAELHSCRVCENDCKCKRWNRDVNAVLNFAVLFACKVVLKGPVPKEFQRKNQSSALLAAEDL